MGGGVNMDQGGKTFAGLVTVQSLALELGSL